MRSSLGISQITVAELFMSSGCDFGLHVSTCDAAKMYCQKYTKPDRIMGFSSLHLLPYGHSVSYSAAPNSSHEWVLVLHISSGASSKRLPSALGENHVFSHCCARVVYFICTSVPAVLQISRSNKQQTTPSRCDNVIPMTRTIPRYIFANIHVLSNRTLRHYLSTCIILLLTTTALTCFTGCVNNGDVGTE